MIKNYLKITLRNIIKHKGISFINIAGLAIGMACSILIFLWVDNQLSFDKSQVQRDRIYRLEDVEWVDMPTIIRQSLSELPEIQKFAMFDSWQTPTLKYKNRFFDIKHFVFVDSCVFDIFTIPFLQGDPKTALDMPFSVVLTESYAKKIFVNENPVGKIVKYDNKFDFTVTGVIEDVGEFHVEINALAPLENLSHIKGRPGFLEEQNWNFLTYLLLHEESNIPLLEEKINKLLDKEVMGVETDLILRPFSEIYFARNLKHENGVKHGNIQLIILFSAIALFILLIACINFINLTTARSSTRAKEIGIRKVVGADQKSLIIQFLGETLLVAVISLVTAIFLIKLFLSTFNRLIGGNIAVNYSDPKLIIGIIIVLFFSGMTAGLFPSFYLSSLSPFEALKGKRRKSLKDAPFRKTLIIFQFSIAVFLIIGALTVFKQINFMKNRDLGFAQEQIININLKGELLNKKKAVFKERLLQSPDILKISYSNQEPGNIGNTNTWDVKGIEKPMIVLSVDPDYVDLMELKLIEGRNFSWDKRSDTAKKYIINEEAAEFLGFESPVGETVRANYGDSEIIGIVKDYHFNSLHNRIGPLAICWYERWADVAHLKISSGNINKTIQYIRGVWSDLCPDFPFNYSFLDESFAQQYNFENRLAEILKYFVFLAIFLSCLGLVGLSAFIAEQKTKEIGIRKVLGSSSFGIVYLLSKDFSRWVILSNIFAWPVAYYATNKWFQNFAYKIPISIWTFVLSASLTLVIALLTVSYQSVRAATANPVDSLRYE